jgi:hypothetical protein
MTAKGPDPTNKSKTTGTVLVIVISVLVSASIWILSERVPTRIAIIVSVHSLDVTTGGETSQLFIPEGPCKSLFVQGFSTLDCPPLSFERLPNGAKGKSETLSQESKIIPLSADGFVEVDATGKGEAFRLGNISILPKSRLTFSSLESPDNKLVQYTFTIDGNASASLEMDQADQLTLSQCQWNYLPRPDRIDSSSNFRVRASGTAAMTGSSSKIDISATCPTAVSFFPGRSVPIEAIKFRRGGYGANGKPELVSSVESGTITYSEDSPSAIPLEIHAQDYLTVEPEKMWMRVLQSPSLNDKGANSPEAGSIKLYLYGTARRLELGSQEDQKKDCLWTNYDSWSHNKSLADVGRILAVLAPAAFGLFKRKIMAWVKPIFSRSDVIKASNVVIQSQTAPEIAPAPQISPTTHPAVPTPINTGKENAVVANVTELAKKEQEHEGS